MWGSQGGQDVRIPRGNPPPRCDSLGNGALIGLAVGGGIGLVGAIAATQDDYTGADEGDWVAFAAAVYAGIGAGIGVGIDALIRREYVIFQPSPAPPRTEVRLVPLLTPKRQGLLVSVSF